MKIDDVCVWKHRDCKITYIIVKGGIILEVSKEIEERISESLFLYIKMSSNYFIFKDLW